MANELTTPAETEAGQGSNQVGLVERMAMRIGVSSHQYWNTLKTSFFPVGASDADIMVCLSVAEKRKLDPFNREIHFYKDPKSGRVVPVIGVDGWVTQIQRQEQLDGIDFDDELDEDGSVIAITCTIYRKDWSRPVKVPEYMAECYREMKDRQGNITGPWKTHPRRMLRHKALIQCARVAFGMHDIMDMDEAMRAGFEPTLQLTPEEIDPFTEVPSAPEEPDNGEAEQPTEQTPDNPETSGAEIQETPVSEADAGESPPGDDSGTVTLQHYSEALKLTRTPKEAGEVFDQYVKKLPDDQHIEMDRILDAWIDKLGAAA